MPRNQAFAVENNFINGLVTETTPLRFPENGCTETYNCFFDETGRVKRRFGFDIEPNSSPATLPVASAAFSQYLWENVAGEDDKTFLVVQVGATIHFYLVNDSVNLSTQKHSDTIDLTSFDVSGAVNIELQECQFSSGNGLLFVSHPQCETFFVTYNNSTDEITGTAIPVKIRDFELLDDGTTAIDHRPTNTVANMDTDHHYNLLNAGWHYDNKAALTAWDTAFTTVPSNADVWWFYKNSTDDFTTSLVAKRYRGNTEAPRGYYILNFYDQDREAASGLTGMTYPGIDMGVVRARTTAFFAGRLWYSDIRYEGQTTKVLFSQIATATDKYGKCYQQNDPTSEDLFDLLPSDGGVININDCGSIVKLWALDNTLLVFTRQGIWSIEGSSGLGFQANDFVVKKISSVHVLSHSSFVDLDGIPCWWNETGIYTLSGPAEDTVGVSDGRVAVRQGSVSVISLSDEKIKSFIAAIPTSSKKFVRGAFDRNSGFAIWLYRQEPTENTPEQWIFDRALVLNTRTGAFFPWIIDLRDEVQLRGLTVVKTFGSSSSPANVTANAGADNVIAGVGNQVISYVQSSEAVPPKFKFIVSTNNTSLTFADNEDTSYVDWNSIITDGEDYDSYFITGFNIHGDAMRHFQANYIEVYTDFMENASCFLRGIWDFAREDTTNKFSIAQQCINVTRNSDWYTTNRKLKIRGKGKALQLYFYSETGRPFSIMGWAKWESGNTGV